MRRPGPRKSPLERWGIAILLGFVHLVPPAALYTGTSRADWIAFGVIYAVSGVALAGGIHRYFAHRAFRTSRPF
jgi:stearoyl-CoA desaturase (delta-9 desaturase)